MTAQMTPEQQEALASHLDWLASQVRAEAPREATLDRSTDTEQDPYTWRPTAGLDRITVSLTWRRNLTEETP